ncbi:GTPase ObgE [Candidatus Aerophobetes bacterium]|nr:GTPase ObgE [Candidatus Aerophobetes bacterium]
MEKDKIFDEAKIYVEGGKGGDGCVSFRREKGVPRGGPDGGDGGDGGCVIIKADKDVTTLIYYHYKKHFVAGSGGHGEGKNKKGKKGQDVLLKVPVGTVVKDEEGKILKDLKKEGEWIVVAKGGKGGRGNTHFKTSTFQTPRKAEKGEEGEKRWIKLELKLIADVGIVGLPNAGKSTLLSRISSARPRIAPYPFTTLRPYLGMVKVDESNSFVVADLPGLIEEASKGKGLGHRFLRHVERSKVLLHLVDVGETGGEDPFKNFQIINRELELYNPELLKKPQLVVASKLDLPGARERFSELREKIAGKFPIMGISARTGEGLDMLIRVLFKMVKEAKD